MFSRSSNKFTPKIFPGHHCVGWVKQAHGIRGEIFVQLYAAEADWLNNLNTIFLLEPKANELKAWEIEIIRPHKEGLIFKLKGIADRNTSETLRKSGVYIPDHLLEAQPGERIFLKQILGFEVVDKAGVRLGKITGFSSNGAQDLLELERDGGASKAALIPLVDEFLLNIDFDKHQVKMDLPQGLLNLEEE